MIKRDVRKDGTVRITFALPDGGKPVSVVADTHAWDPMALPMKKRSNGTRSVSVEVPKGSHIRFRYLDADGLWFDDPDGDHHEPNGFGQSHTVVAV